MTRQERQALSDLASDLRTYFRSEAPQRSWISDARGNCAVLAESICDRIDDILRLEPQSAVADRGL